MHAYSDAIQIVKDGIVDDQDFGLVFRIPAISSISGEVWKGSKCRWFTHSGEPALEGRTLTLLKERWVPSEKRVLTNASGQVQI